MSGASQCARHPQRAAVAHCRRCGQPICLNCVLQTGSGVFCGIQCAELAESHQARIESATPVLNRRFDPWRSFRLGVVLAALCAVFYSIMFLAYGMINPMAMVRRLWELTLTLLRLATR